MTSTTARRAILTRLADAAVTEQMTEVDGRGAVRARLVVADDGAHIDLDWVSSDGVAERMPQDVYDSLADHSDTDEIEDAIRAIFDGADVKVEIDWRETQGVVNVDVTTRTTPRNGGDGGIHYRATSRFGRDHLSIGDAGNWADGVRMAPLVEEARAGKSITGYDYEAGAVDEQAEQDARAALLRLAAALGF